MELEVRRAAVLVVDRDLDYADLHGLFSSQAQGDEGRESRLWRFEYLV